MAARSIEDATALANARLAHFGSKEQVPLRQTERLRLPDGWRLIYEVYVSDFVRLRDSMYIVFVRDDVPDDQAVELEAVPPGEVGSAADTPTETVKEPSLLRVNKVRPTLTDASLTTLLPHWTDVVDWLTIHYGDFQIVAWEPVAEPERAISVHWRVILLKDMNFVRLEIAKEGNQIVEIKPQADLNEIAMKSASARSIRIGQYAYSSDIRKVTLSFLKPGSVVGDPVRGRIIVQFFKEWVHTYMTALGYDVDKLRDISVLCEVIDDDTAAALFNASGGQVSREMVNAPAGSVPVQAVPVLVFPINKAGICWADDPSIVIHEIGHAVWYLLYTRVPTPSPTAPIVAGESPAAVEEGFCDYFAAAIIDEITSWRKLKVGRLYWSVCRKAAADLGTSFQMNDLPRYVRARRPPKETNGMDAKYVFGWRWANFLWNLRMQLLNNGVSGTRINQAIFLAHFRPRPMDGLEQSITGMYVESLRRAFAQLGINGQVDIERALTEHELRPQPPA